MNNSLVQRLYEKKNKDKQDPNISVRPLVNQGPERVLVPRISKKKLPTLDDSKPQVIHIGQFTLSPNSTKARRMPFITMNDESTMQRDASKLLVNQSQPNLRTNVSLLGASNLLHNRPNASNNDEKRNYLMSKKIHHPKGSKKNKKQNEDHLTPFDFIALLRSDADMADEFCYLNKMDDPYDWIIIDFDKKNPREYMTISARGITHFIEDQTTFLTIEEWEREVALYRKIKSIPFFKDYKNWKNFTLWKQLHRRNTMKKHSQYLNQELFVLSVHLQGPLLNIKKVMVEEFSKWDLFEISTTEARSVDEFIKAQDKARTTRLHMIEKTEGLIKGMVQESCDKSLNAFKEENRISSKTDANTDEEPPPLLVGDETNKEMPYTQEATIRTHYRKLRKFIKLIDYVILDAKLNMMENTSIKLNHVIHNQNDLYREILADPRSNIRLTPILSIKSEFQGTNIKFAPTREQTQRIFEEATIKAINLVCNKHKQLILDQDFSLYTKTNDYIEDPTDEIIDIQNLITNNEVFRQKLVSIKKELEVSFDFITDASRKLEPLVEIYWENTSLDLAIFEEKEVLEIRQAIQKFREQDERFQEIEAKTDVGIFVLDNFDLKEKIKNCAANCIKQLEKMLPELNNRRSNELYQELYKFNSILEKKPTSVDEFVQFKIDVTSFDAKFDSIRERNNMIEDLKKLMEENFIKLSENMKSELNNVFKEFKNFKTKLDQAKEFVDSKMNNYRRELERLTGNIEPRIKDLSARLYDPMVSDIKSVSKDVVDYLTTLSKDVNLLVEDKKKYNRYQETLEIDQSMFDNIDQFKADFDLNFRLWKAKYNWEQNVENWKRAQFMDDIIVQLRTNGEKTAKEANFCVRKLEMNQVAKLFVTEVDAFKNFVECYACLRDPALKYTHWKEVQEVIERPNVPIELYENRYAESLTLDSLLQLDLIEFKEKLQEIATKAVKEKELQDMLTTVKHFWSGSIFTTINYKDNLDIFILGNNEELITKLDDSLVTLSNILSSRYVEPIRTEVESERKKFRYVQRFIDEWINLQKNWMYLESIFNAEGISKTLAQEHRSFRIVDDFWKKNLMKNAVELRLVSKFNSEELIDVAILEKHNRTLENIQKKLESFLEQKRTKFPRFYFLSNDEIIEVLSDAKDARLVQVHLRKIFENIVRLDFYGSDTVVAMFSAENERVKLKLPLTASGNVEDWLKKLEAGMVETLKSLLNVIT